ncbi:MAG: NADH-quinone oxidoreductase subunit C [Bacteroidetes bacterium]|nr:MAG: NADH-quinone oxidoreductase subunit C [Bacteroidota bacterium]
MKTSDITKKVYERFGSHILEAENDGEFLTYKVAPDKVTEMIEYLYNEPELAYRYLTTLFAVHYPEISQIVMHYLLHNLEKNSRIRIKVFVGDTNPEIDTLTGIFSAANWLERETYDFFGVKFIGHPNLKRILNVEDMTIHPLRKEYPLEDQMREDKKDEMFGR